MSASLLKTNLSNQASAETIYHCLYGYYFLGIKKNELARIYAKSKSIVANWIENFEKEGHVERKKGVVDEIYRKFDETKRRWLLNLFKEKPILFQREAAQLYFRKFNQTISTSSISIIRHKEGLTWKVLERRAIQIREQDVARFYREMSEFDWYLHNLVVLDEVSCDNNSMLRNHGYSVKGQKLIYNGEFVRKPRVSLLCFINSNGMIDSYQTEGTFNRKTFALFCRQFALEHCEQHPGRNSVWILDGAAIHCDANIVTYLRSLGIVVVFLPAYCPVFNPIEIVFGLIKRYLKRIYVENSREKIDFYIGKAVKHFSKRNLLHIYRKCGYIGNGMFDPADAFY